jgi:hypothetical protein
MIEKTQLQRWRLILGDAVDDELENFSGLANQKSLDLSADQIAIDESLAAIYDETNTDLSQVGKRSAGHGKSSPLISKWLTDIRTFFPEDIVSVIQSDAIERRGLTQLLFEPELLKNVKADISMVTTLMSLKGKIPEQTKQTARELVAVLVAEINKRLASGIKKAVSGALNKKSHSPIPNVNAIDWKYTIRKNLKNYNQDMKKIIPERFYFFDRARQTNNWTVIMDMDQSGSMADSIIYGSVVGSIFASIQALKTHVVAFDTEVVDLSEKYGNDPVDMIFGIQLGGGTDINKSVAYCEQFVTEPAKTLFILLTDLFEGGNRAALVRRLREMQEAGVKVICLLALSDRGKPMYDERLAKKLSSFAIPCFACSPNLLPDFIEGVLKEQDLIALSEKIKKRNKYDQ